MSWPQYRDAVKDAVLKVARRARQPQERVARHFVSTGRVVWFGASADHHDLHVSWSYGALKEKPHEPRALVGVFRVTRGAFPEVDDVALRSQLEALVPEGTDGATRVWLQRVAAQLAVVEALAEVQRELGAEVLHFARPDAPTTAALPFRWPTHALDRVEAALQKMDLPLPRDRG